MFQECIKAKRDNTLEATTSVGQIAKLLRVVKVLRILKIARILKAFKLVE
jgi:hypothetical protein